MANRNEGIQQQSQPQGRREESQGLERRGGEENRLGRGRQLGSASPFGLLGRMMNDMDRWFGGGFGELVPWTGRERLGGLWNPQIEVLERNGSLVVHADLPGLKPEDVEVNVENDVLTLRGERRFEEERNEEGVYHSERSYGRFERSIALPNGIDPSSIEAKFENGVLEITAPMPKEQARGRRIDVKPGSGPTQTKVQEPKKTSH